MLGGKSVPLVGQQGVKYGLQAPATSKKALKTKALFAGSDDDADVNDLNAAVRAQQGVKRSDAKINKAHAAALQEDANCFEYDAFYDTIQEERKEVELASFKREQQGPRYLAAMMSARDRRQRIQDMAYNRREALAAQAEDGLYEGKEKFATAAYRKKLEEDKLFAEQLAEQDKADEGRTVEKMGMDGFLGVMKSALASTPSDPTEGGMTAVAAEHDAGARQAAGAGAIDAKMQKRAEAALKKRLDAMDAGELKRYRLEQHLKGQAGAAGAEPAGRSTDAHESGGELLDGVAPLGRGSKADDASAHERGLEDVGRSEGGRRAGGKGRGGSPGAAEGGGGSAKRRVRKHADEDKIAAARERAKQRKLMRS